MPHKKPSNSKTSFNEERILSEIIDLWSELRAIREMMEEDYAPELPTLKLDLSGPFERFVAKLSELEGDWSNAKEEMNFFSERTLRRICLHLSNYLTKIKTC